jgi:hypothetical protein
MDERMKQAEQSRRILSQAIRSTVDLNKEYETRIDHKKESALAKRAQLVEERQQLESMVKSAD